MNVIVTGANGQLGTCIRDLADEHTDINFLFNDIDELDIQDYEAVEEMVLDFHPDVLVNCASYNAVDRAEDEPLEALKINGKAVQGLAGLARKHGFGLIHISTDYIFDGKKGNAYTELDEPHPQSKYAHSKFIGEQAIQTASPNAAIIRTSWLYSEHAHNFVKTIRRLAAERNEIRVVNDQQGTPTYAGDLASVIMEMLRHVNSFDEVRVYNYSNEGVTSWAEFAEQIISFSGLSCQVIPVTTEEYGMSKAARPAYSLLDTSKIKEYLNISIPDWKDSLQNCIEKLDNQ
jgi:dTDP-4-dehydrorhamnose reductase